MIEIMKEFKEWDISDLDLDTKEGMKKFNKIMNERNDLIESLKEDIEKYIKMIDNMKIKIKSYTKNKIIPVGKYKMNSIDVNKNKLLKSIKHLLFKIKTNKELIYKLKNE